ncbi:hypothetical protein [Bacillus sp. BP-3]|uniref:hypothetical protein n=1 Tax=Bacillus sp. BP-3 TaxID=3022773 RepID=UPI00232B0B82|nr:hypothetical protein [Bacillus sp. BP-3]MDC2867918.1 hypothetical protein [Bacillus sp. BP-3]
MNLSISDELELFSKELQRYMSPHVLEQLAREIGFVQRKRVKKRKVTASILKSDG